MRPQDLLIDIGNSTTVMATYDGHTLSPIEKVPTDQFQMLYQSYGLDTYRRVVVSSVVPSVDPLLSGFPTVRFITYATIPQLTLNVDLPAQVGADRLVNALAAYREFGRDCIVIDSGTAVTLCYVSKEGVYHGGLIFPGMGIASKALALYTAKIPIIEVSAQDAVLGKTTKDAVGIGLYLGYIHMINGLIAMYRKQFPGVYVVGAGSGLSVLQDKLDVDVVDPLLTLKGLAHCLTLNP